MFCHNYPQFQYNVRCILHTVYFITTPCNSSILHTVYYIMYIFSQLPTITVYYTLYLTYYILCHNSPQFQYTIHCILHTVYFVTTTHNSNILYTVYYIQYTLSQLPTIKVDHTPYITYCILCHNSPQFRYTIHCILLTVYFVTTPNNSSRLNTVYYIQYILSQLPTIRVYYTLYIT